MSPEQSTREKVRDLTNKGHVPRQIALLLGISTQAVYQHLAKLGMEPARKESA